ncbi:hypothetical protein KR222_000659, partial [Zaprionus bogoriensis]
LSYQEFLLVTFFALASGGLLPAKSTGSAEAIDAHPRYSFSYDVQDATSGDVKAQTETRDGDQVRGHYTLNDADGYRRIVDYTVNAEQGFNAVVRREPLKTARPDSIVAKKPKAPVLALQLQPVQPAVVVRSYVAPTLSHHMPLAHFVHRAAATPELVARIAHPATISYVF